MRLWRGDYQRERVYAADPAAVAAEFVALGARRLHVVDLDAARGAPDPLSTAAVTATVARATAAGCAVEVAGGIRDLPTATSWIERGASRVVVGSLALTDPPLAAAICLALAGRVLLSLDVRDGRACHQGWTREGGAVEEVLDQWSNWQPAGVICTAIDRDGTLAGPDVTVLRRCRQLLEGEVICAGGIGSPADIDTALEAGADAVVVGRALYEGRVDLAAALASHPGDGSGDGSGAAGVARAPR